MTLLPCDLPAKGVKGPKYPLNSVCSMPSCSRPATEGHHLWRRSALGGAFDFVEVDGVTFHNLTGLCHEHHRDVTGGVGGHRARIDLVDGVFYWVEMPSGYSFPLDPQPGRLKKELHVHAELEEGQTCPQCGHRKPRAKKEPARRKTRWQIQVPDDAENGTEVIDGLLEAWARAVGRPADTPKYFTLVEALVFAVQHEHLLEVSG